ncbi:MAG TPA: HesA/MoeB/ThiF family protein [Syntrophaceticus sp.]|nr:HesA/MoeB/ThiF family protein [Syntrophaceticus sp.]
MISVQDRERYERQIMLEEIGEQGQLRLAKSRVLVVGAGGLGSAVLYYLAAAGIGTIGVVDDQNVELSNLQRQILHSTARIGMPKVVSAKQTLLDLNPGITILPYHIRLDRSNAAELVSQYDLVISALDNEETRFLLNENCVSLRKPMVDGGVQGFYGRLLTILPGEGPCYACIFPHKDDRSFKKQGSEDMAIPVFSTTPGIIGILQAQEAFKILLGVGTALVGKILFYDGLTTTFQKLEVGRVNGCTCCSQL